MDESEDISYEDGFPGPPDLTPSLLQFSIGGMGRSSGVIWSVEEQVLKVHMADGGSTEVEVTPAQWKTFWFVVEQLGVWTWRAEYENPNVLDGTSWELVMVDGSRRIRSSGSNAFPGGFDEQDENSPFNQLLAAINMLCHRDDIR